MHPDPHISMNYSEVFLQTFKTIGILVNIKWYLMLINPSSPWFENHASKDITGLNNECTSLKRWQL